MRNHMKQFLARLFRPRVKQWNLNKSIGWKSDNEILAGKKILFVQLQFNSSDRVIIISDELETLEKAIDANLQRKNMGKLLTSEQIESNYTMLFLVNDYVPTVQVIKDTVETTGLAESFLIAKRIYKTNWNWKYKILYPENTLLRFEELQ